MLNRNRVKESAARKTFSQILRNGTTLQDPPNTLLKDRKQGKPALQNCNGVPRKINHRVSTSLLIIQFLPIFFIASSGYRFEQKEKQEESE
jgi:hypothetical protein